MKNNIVIPEIAGVLHLDSHWEREVTKAVCRPGQHVIAQLGALKSKHTESY